MCRQTQVVQRLLLLLLAFVGLCSLQSAPSGDLERKAQHWAYQRIQRLNPPEVKNRAWARSDTDRFVLVKIEEAGLSPAADADRLTLLRRVYFDLIGLPPKPEEIDAFLRDDSARAFGTVVERLLDSPHFGERWGRHWLDVARYAESVTLRGLVFKEAWRYRDYVIQSFNKDLPFDQFIREQIAGDLLKYTNVEDAQRGRIATTYLVLGNHNYEEQDKEQLRMDIVDEQLDTIGKGLLAQTIGCARCHDHKFDPIPTRDYYAMAGILRNTKSVEHANVSAWLEMPLPVAPKLEAELTAKEARLAELEKEIKEKTEALAGLTGNAAKESTPPDTLPGIVIDDSEAKLVGEWKSSQYNKPYVGRGYIHDENTGKGAKTATFHPGLKSGGKYEVRLAYTPGENRASNVPATILHAAGETTVHVNEKVRPTLQGHFVSLGQFEFEAGNQGYVLVSNGGTDGHVIADAVQFLPLDVPDSPVKVILAETSAAAKSLKNELEALRAEVKRLKESEPRRPLVMSVKEETKIEDARIHIRGSVHKLGPQVPRGFLQVASAGRPSSMQPDESGRREFAEWIASTNNPLTARVFVNRAWLWLFGAGIVRTPDNFGTTGEVPSHPELLDYLVTRFMEEGWSVKRLVRELVLSRAYRLSSAANVSLLQADPENRLFARANRRRLEAECLRDGILAASGRLKLDMYENSIKAGTTADFGYTDDSNRRSIYVPAFRNALPEIFALFDFADTSVVTGQRSASVVAPQALFFLNHPFVLENARAAAEKLLASGSFDERVRAAYLVTLTRPPTSREESVIREHLARSEKEGLAQLDAWTEIFQGLFASMDFRYLN